jgi:hypothetical protein
LIGLAVNLRSDGLLKEGGRNNLFVNSCDTEIWKLAIDIYQRSTFHDGTYDKIFCPITTIIGRRRAELDGKCLSVFIHRRSISLPALGAAPPLIYLTTGHFAMPSV